MRRITLIGIILLALSLFLNAKYLLSKYAMYRARLKEKTDQLKSPNINVFTLIRVKEFAVLPIDTTSIVFLGNSLTQNFEISEFFKNKPVKNRGINGETTQNVLDRLNEIIVGKPKKIFIEIGINDLFSGIAVDTVKDHISRMITMIQKGSPRTIIYLQSLLPATNNDENVQNLINSIKELNSKLKLLSEKFNVVYIDLYSAFNSNSRLNLTYDCGDHLHLNGNGYFKWKDVIKKYVN